MVDNKTGKDKHADSGELKNMLTAFDGLLFKGDRIVIPVKVKHRTHGQKQNQTKS